MAARTTTRRTTATAETAPEATEEAPRRRRRRRTKVDHATEATILVNALLETRGGKGAPHSALVAIAEWARNFHEEETALRSLALRPRRAKAEASTSRLAQYEVNRTLLDGVLAGSLGLDVDEAGNILFVTRG